MRSGLLVAVTVAAVIGAALLTGGQRASASAPILCFGTITGASITGNLEVPSGVICELNGTTVAGNVVVDSNASLVEDSNATIKGSVTGLPGANFIVLEGFVGGALQANGLVAVDLCGATEQGSVTIQNTGFIALGDTDGSCAGNTIRGAVTLLNNGGEVIVNGNTIGGRVVLNGNNVFEFELGPNTINGALACSGNSPAPDNEDGTNTVKGARSGQCAAPFV
jgi:hypothetical protein